MAKPVKKPAKKPANKAQKNSSKASSKKPSKNSAKKPPKKAAKAQANQLPVKAPVPPPMPGPDGLILDRLWATVMSRRDADPDVSHSARLLSRGTAKVAQKLGEEAVEAVIEATLGNRAALIGESADMLYHLMVVWVDAGIRPEEVWAELERREAISGIAEKAARARALKLRAIARRGPAVRTSKLW
ncbi:phosphoribosyl-ATP diphosphatase [Elioraea sp.]|uniref:phosphoribosyl-ATP diphosphatase n=1 Tax=Elioraea sp. TaxID=2185103 RepID=UPI0025C3B274|nr:phosphoribosyl-ATP diphosphatase [Elioraea sp.]